MQARIAIISTLTPCRHGEKIAEPTLRCYFDEGVNALYRKRGIEGLEIGDSGAASFSFLGRLERLSRRPSPPFCA